MAGLAVASFGRSARRDPRARVAGAERPPRGPHGLCARRAASAIPLPFVPDRLVRRVRGALVHDVGSRHGLSFTSDARDLLANPGSSDRHALVNAAENVARALVRRFVAPLGVLSAAARALEVYAFGLLLERYVRDVRPRGAAGSAFTSRRRAPFATRSIAPSSAPSTLGPRRCPDDRESAGIEDLRDELTRWIDAALPGDERERAQLRRAPPRGSLRRNRPRNGPRPWLTSAPPRPPPCSASRSAARAASSSRSARRASPATRGIASLETSPPRATAAATSSWSRAAPSRSASRSSPSRRARRRSPGSRRPPPPGQAS